MDTALWKADRYLDFLEARKALLAAEANRRFEALLHGDLVWMGNAAPLLDMDVQSMGGITSETEEAELEAINAWVEQQGLPRGTIGFDFADAATGAQKAVFDLAWPEGLQPGLTGPVAVLLHETGDVLALASAARFRCFTTSADFRIYIEKEIFHLEVR